MAQDASRGEVGSHLLFAIMSMGGARARSQGLARARPLRIEYDGAQYHVMNRGNARRRVACIESLLGERAANHDSKK
jgi:hypothetical protein